MAIDLASNSSSFGFQNMLPLDVLAAVASEKLKNEIHIPDTSKSKTSSNVKKHIKKSVTSALTFDDIKYMPPKLLIEKFSEMTSDELTKKYSYQCLLLPQKCSSTFKSFGNEKKACDEMKSHLLLHIQQLAMECESSKEISGTLFIPRSPNSNSKYAEKLAKKLFKKQQTSLNGTLPQTNSSKTLKKSKNLMFSSKALKKKLYENKKSVSESKNICRKAQEKNVNSVYLNNSFEQIYDDTYLSCDDDDDDFWNKRIKVENPKEIDSECDSEHYSSYSRHLNSFFTDAGIKGDITESLSSSEQALDLNDSSISCEGFSSSSSQSDNMNFDKSISFLQDHNYTCLDGTKIEKLPTPEFRNMPRKYENPFLFLKSDELPPCIIKTPPFPYIHTPLLPEVAQIVEIRLQDSNFDLDRYSHSVNYFYGLNTVKSEDESLSDEYLSDPEDRYPDGLFYKMSGSVLECVENIENKKYSSSCVPKSEISASENDENLENLQKDEKELALKYIAKLHSKGKKKISDSLICKICPDKHFTAQATLIHHYRSHAGIKPYICQLCSSKFTRQHSLNYHMLIHQNLSRFTCDFCGRTFRHPSHYKEHLRRHTGETPYHCTECNLHFKTRNTFKRHLKTRHGKLLTAGGIEDLH